MQKTFSRNKGSPQDLKQTSTYGELRILQQGVKGTQDSFERWRQGRTRFCATLDFPSFGHMEAIEGSEEGSVDQTYTGKQTLAHELRFFVS